MSVHFVGSAIQTVLPCGYARRSRIVPFTMNTPTRCSRNYQALALFTIIYAWQMLKILNFTEVI